MAIISQTTDAAVVEIDEITFDGKKVRVLNAKLPLRQFGSTPRIHASPSPGSWMDR